MEANNPIIQTTEFHAGTCKGWIIREYKNGKYDAIFGKEVLSPGFDSFQAVSEYVAAQVLAGFTNQTETIFGYGPNTPGSHATITGFSSLQECLDTAETWLKKGIRWDKKLRRYVEVEDGRREVKVYQGDTVNGRTTWQERGRIVALKRGSEVTVSTWI